MVFDQSLVAVQRSRSLLDLGAINGALLTLPDSWRLVASQFLHVQFPHMLFNALCVALLGGVIERQWSWRAMLVLYFVGGTIGQLASVLATPHLVSSGASQALMAVCAGILVAPVARHWKIAAAIVLVFQAGLDYYVAQSIKAGHLWGFLAGLLLAALFASFRTEGQRPSRQGA